MYRPAHCWEIGRREQARTHRCPGEPWALCAQPCSALGPDTSALFLSAGQFPVVGMDSDPGLLPSPLTLGPLQNRPGVLSSNPGVRPPSGPWEVTLSPCLSRVGT